MSESQRGDVSSWGLSYIAAPYQPSLRNFVSGVHGNDLDSGNYWFFNAVDSEKTSRKILQLQRPDNTFCGLADILFKLDIIGWCVAWKSAGLCVKEMLDAMQVCTKKRRERKGGAQS
jgi:hypothetical protein